ncbi:MAG: glycosyltransferase family 4 protein [Rhodobacteraceae bacterium]|jgi:alpha-1,3-rhamnosyl/mannosyltransferase|uniref:glycosyltransferase family 4 protein n=1 Tax=Albidovulum sp. TaxID=1872424 RepID=UPI001D7BE7AA|nr:glycosyltransferase family 1 protein [uncultured Defluviimonas sp.]MCB2126475.1 glycosyltransferase family 4 protein [Paracoccaceae bacterium]MCC0068712.1 glycosyltransferase family 4 protein [Paracoccaceae bacterium]
MTIHVGIDGSAWDNERGFGRFTRSLVAALASRRSGFRYTLVCDRPPERPVPAGVATRVAGARRSMAEASSGKGARGSSDMLTLSRAAAGLGADLLFWPASYSFYPVLSRVPKLVCIHDTIPERFPELIFPTRRNFRLWQAKSWLARAQARRILTVSEASARDIAEMLHVARDRIDVTTEGADASFRPLTDPARLARARARHGIAPEDRVLTYVGGFNRHKNVLRLIEAMPRILAACPDARLVIVGRTTGARFWDNVDDLKAGASKDARASERISFTGEVSDADMAELLAASEALVFPSLWEGFGLPAVEAMYCGTPVLASNRGSLPEVVGGAGLFFDPERTEDLAGAAIRLLGEPGLRAFLGRAAEERAVRFTWESSAELTEQSFLRTLGRA